MRAMESDRIKSWPVNERPREKLLAEGPEKQTAADLLAIILRVGRGTFKKGVPGQNAQAFARTLLSQFGDLHGLDRATIPELLKVPGLSKAKVAQIKAAFELGKRACTKRLTPPRSIPPPLLPLTSAPASPGNGRKSSWPCF